MTRIEIDVTDTPFIFTHYNNLDVEAPAINISRRDIIAETSFIVRNSRKVEGDSTYSNNFPYSFNNSGIPLIS